MPKILSQQRFDDVGDADEDGYVDYAYHGFNYTVEVANRKFNVRTYDDEPGVATVISPTDARHLAETTELLEFLADSLSCSRFQIYYGPIGSYKEVDPKTLALLEKGT